MQLGLTDDAEKLLNQYEQRFSVTPEIVRLRKAIAAQRGDYRSCAKLAKQYYDESAYQLSDLHAANLAGEPAWAYSQCLALEEEDTEDDSGYWFNRSCFASRVGEYQDASTALWRCFARSKKYHADAFLDPDLSPLWRWMCDVALDDALAEKIADMAWAWAAYTLATGEGELTLTPLMRQNVPEPFRRHIPIGSMGKGLCADPTMPADLYEGYLRWQRETASIQMRLLTQAGDRARDYLYDQQPRFALWQARNGNLTAVRYHLFFHLIKFPQHLGRWSFLRKYGMGYMLESLLPPIQEDEKFAEKIQHAGQWAPNDETARAILESIGPTGQNTEIYKLRLAHLELQSGNHAAGIALFTEVIRTWPDDAAAYSRLTGAFIENGRWEEARLCFQAAPAHSQFFWIREDHRIQIEKEDSSASIDMKRDWWVFCGQRNLGGVLKPGCYPGSNATTGTLNEPVLDSCSA